MPKSAFQKRDTFVSVVVLATSLRSVGAGDAVRKIQQQLDLYFEDYEIVIVANKPGTFPGDQLDSLLREIPSVRVLELSFGVDYEIAISAGLENAIGDYVVIFDPTHDPFDTIYSVVEMCRDDIEIVVGVAKNMKRSIPYRMFRPFMNLFLAEIGYQIPKNATSLRCLSRPAVQSATRATNFHHKIFVRIAQCGLTSHIFEYAMNNAYRRKKTLRRAFKDTLRLLVFNSTRPLRWMSALGFFGSFFALAFATYSFLTRLIRENIAEGWSSTVILISFLFMVLFMMLSFFGEYLARLLSDQSRHDSYWVVDEKHSSVMVNTDRRNVLDSSES